MSESKNGTASPLVEADPNSLELLFERVNAKLALNEHERIIWLAGLLEGEGYFGMYEGERGQGLTIQIAMTDLDVIEKVAVMFRANIKRSIPKNPKHKEYFTVRIVGYKAYRLMNTLLPYMGNRRTEAITKALKAWEGREHSGEHGLAPTCHPDRKYHAKGMCKSCYSKMLYAEGRLAVCPSHGIATTVIAEEI